MVQVDYWTTGMLLVLHFSENISENLTFSVFSLDQISSFPYQLTENGRLFLLSMFISVLQITHVLYNKQLKRFIIVYVKG